MPSAGCTDCIIGAHEGKVIRMNDRGQCPSCGYQLIPHSPYKTDTHAWIFKEPTPMPTPAMCSCGHLREHHEDLPRTNCKLCPCTQYLHAFTATQAKKDLETALAKPGSLFPFAHRDRYEVAYTLLTWELLKLLENLAPSDVYVARHQVIEALAKAAGELS